MKKLEVYTLGKSEGQFSFCEGFKYVSLVSIEAMDRIIQRIDLEEDRISVTSVPIGGIKGTKDLTSMIDKAEQGYKRLFRMSEAESYDPSKVFGRLGFESDEDVAAQFINGVLSPDKLVDPNDGFNLSIAFSLRNTIQSLVQKGEVSFCDLGITPKDGDISFNLIPSYWRCNLTPGTIWDTTRDMGTVLNNAIWKKGLIEDTANLYKAAHFFCAATSLRTIN